MRQSPSAGYGSAVQVSLSPPVSGAEARLLAALQAYPGLIVAFSAGVDSALLLAAAARSIGTANVLAATADSDSLPAAELTYARDFAKTLGVRHVVAQTREMDRSGYRVNASDRCYFCKAELLDVLSGHLSAMPNGARVATGTNADDLASQFRPGIRAAAERGAVTPLADVGLTKKEVRALARRWQLSVWDKPQAACLSSRVAFGVQITPRTLAAVEAAEIAVRAELLRLGTPSRDLRVRDRGQGRATVELDTGLASTTGQWQSAVAAAVRSCGFSEVTIDPRGYRSGSMHDLVPPALD